MRSHNHLAVKEKCKVAIPSLMTKFKLGAVDEIRVDELGWVNPTIFINEKYVFRFNARDINLPKLQRELFSLKILKDNLIPVPEIVAFDSSKTVCPYDVLVTKKIDGYNLEQDWPKLDKKKKCELAYQAGNILSKIHKIKIEFFGDLASEGPLPQTTNWATYLKKRLEFHLLEAKSFDLFNDTFTAMVRNIFKSMSSIDAFVLREASFVHIDYHLGNILYKDTVITSILDFEWSLAGDPLYDFCSIVDMDKTWPDSQKSFLNGYGKHTFTDIETKRIKFYQMLKNIELCVVAKRHFPVEELNDFLNTTRKQAEQLRLLIQ